MISIRRFLTLVTLSVITLAVFVASLQGFRKGVDSSQAFLDEQLIEKSILLSTHSSHQYPSYRQLLSVSDELLIQKFDRSGKLLWRSPRAPDAPLSDNNGFANISFNGKLWRVFNQRYEPQGIRVVLAEPVLNRYRIAEEIILQTISPMLVTLPILLCLVWLTVWLGFKPLNRLTSQVKNRHPENLNPLETETLPTELQPLAQAMNSMLDQVSSSFEREKRFSGDAAHELRTPLSAMKINLYNLSTQIAVNTLPDVERIEHNLARMENVIDQLLLLYRTSSSELRRHFVVIDLYALVREVIANNYTIFEARDQDISLQGEVTILEGNEFALTAAVKNLLDNASKYTPEGGTILVQVALSDQNVNGFADALLSVEDNGAGVLPEQMPRLMERFYRLPREDRQGVVLGAGLGLAIVKHVVDLHRGSVALSHSQFETGLRVELLLPCQKGKR